jgi:NAD(P)H dehydrogenase (quinone)
MFVASSKVGPNESNFFGSAARVLEGGRVPSRLPNLKRVSGMRVLIVHAHPEEKSFNSALTRTAVEAFESAGHTVTVSDLYKMEFQAPSDRANFTTVADADYLKLQMEERYASANDGFAQDLELEIKKLEECDLLIFQFPLFWFHMPAILKGWVDRVFVMNRIYGGSVGIYDTGRFRGRKAMLSFTTGAGEDTWVAGGRHGDINNMLKPIHRGIFEFVGYDVLKPNMVCGPVRASDEQRAKMLEDWRVRCLTLADEEPIVIGSY